MPDFIWTRALVRPGMLVCLLAGLGCAYASWALAHRLRTRHPDSLAVRRSTWGVPRLNRAWLRLVWRGGHRALGDPGLSARVRWLHGCLAVMWGGVVASFVGLVLSCGEPSKPTLSRATTFITQPVLASGIPDYEAHLGGARPPERNFARRLIEIMGRSRHRDEGRLTPWPEGSPFQDCLRDGEPSEALAEWTRRNAEAIDALRKVEAGLYFHVPAGVAVPADGPRVVDLFHLLQSLTCEALSNAHAGEAAAARRTLRSVIHAGQALRTASQSIHVAIADAVLEAVANALTEAPLGSLGPAWLRQVLAELAPAPNAEELVDRMRLVDLKLTLEVLAHSNRWEAGRQMLDAAGRETNRRCDAVLSIVRSPEARSSERLTARLDSWIDSHEYVRDPAAQRWSWFLGQDDAYLGRSVAAMVPQECALAPRIAWVVVGWLRLQATLRAHLQRLETGTWPETAESVTPHFDGPDDIRDAVVAGYQLEDDRMRWTKPQ